MTCLLHCQGYLCMLDTAKNICAMKNFMLNCDICILFVLWYLLICGVEIGIMCSLIGFCTGLRFVFYQFAINGF